jgi:hypothetical protein
VRKIVMLAVAVALLAGCGGGGGGSKQQSASPGSGSTGGAAVAPASTPFLLRLDTAFDSAQWRSFDTLLRKFPDGTKLYSSIGGKNADFERDVKPALGPETDVLALSADDVSKNVFVGLAQPRNEAKFQTLLAKGSPPALSEQIAGWHVVADERATIDRFKQARNAGVLADDGAYKEASAALPADALATLYVSGGALTKAIDARAKTGTGPLPGVGRIAWLSGALTAQEKGLGLDFRLKGDELTATGYTPELPAEVPADVVLFADFKGLDAALEQLRRMPAVSKQLGAAGAALGGLLDEVIALFKNEGAVYVRRQASGPEYTLVLKVADVQAAQATLDKIGTLAGAALQKIPEPVTVAGVSAQKIALGNGKTSLYYAVFDGKLVVTNAESGIEGLKAGGERLADSQAWQDATKAAAMPDTTAGILYADVQRAVPLLAELAKQKALSPQVERNLAPLGTALVFGSVDGGIASIKGFVSVR